MTNEKTVEWIAFRALMGLAHVRKRRHPGLIRSEIREAAKLLQVTDPEMLEQAALRVEAACDHLREP